MKTLLALILVAIPVAASAQTDEIQVYDGGLAAKGKFNLTLHSNVTPNGVTTPAFPGAVVADKSFNGVPEWAYGVTDWFEAGLYLPLYSHDKKQGMLIDGFKLRALFAVPNADDRRFTASTSSSAPTRSTGTRTASRRRCGLSWLAPEAGRHIVNPILDTSYDGTNLDFAHPRAWYSLPQNWAVALENRGLRTSPQVHSRRPVTSDLRSR